MDIEIDRAHSTGRTQAGKSRSIVLRCLRFKDKDIILRMANKLKNTGIYINEYFLLETLHTRKELFQKAKVYRSKDKAAKVTAGKLITWEIAKVDDEQWKRYCTYYENFSFSFRWLYIFINNMG